MTSRHVTTIYQETACAGIKIQHSFKHTRPLLRVVISHKDMLFSSTACGALNPYT